MTVSRSSMKQSGSWSYPTRPIIEEIVEAALDYEKCPYEAEVNVILTDNDAIQRHQ